MASVHACESRTWSRPKQNVGIAFSMTVSELMLLYAVASRRMFMDTLRLVSIFRGVDSIKMAILSVSGTS